MNKHSQHKKRSVFMNIIHVSLSNMYRHILGLITMIFRPSLLGPELYGLWSLLNVIPMYSEYGHLGTKTAMRFGIPQALDDEERLRQITQNTLFVSVLVNALIVLFLILGAFVIEQPLVQQIGLVVIAVVVFLECIYKHITAELRGYQHFYIVSRATYLRYTLNFLFTILLIYFWGIYGALAALVLSILITLIYLYKQHPIKFHFVFQLNVILDLMKTGVPIVMLSLIDISLRNIDKLLVATFMGMRALGFYALGNMLMGTLMNIPGASREVTEQILMGKHSSLTIHEQLSKFLFRSLRFNAYFMPLLIACFYFGLPVILNLALPEYEESLRPAQLLMIGGYFFALSYPCRGVIVANKWQKKAAFYASLSVLVSGAMISILLLTGYQLSGAAIGAALGFLSLFSIIILFILIQFEQKIVEYAKEILELFVPFLLMLSLFMVIEAFKQFYTTQFFWQSVISLTIFFVGYLPFLQFARHKQRFIIKIKD